MTAVPPILAVEDPLSEAICRRMLSDFGLAPISTIGLRGKAYLKSKAKGLNDTALGYPVMLLVDLDTEKDCAPGLVSEFLDAALSPMLLFRVAIMEAESWVLADRSSISEFLRIPVNKIPNNVDSLADPKRFLVNLARRSKNAAIRRELVPGQFSTSLVGPAYNSTLSRFVRDCWRPNEAATCSRSLEKALTAMGTWTESIA